MKKMLFTAIALVAFAGTSMANTIKEETIINEVEITIENKKVELERQRHDDCVQVAIFMLDLYDPTYSWDAELSNAFYQAHYTNCMLN